MQRDVECTACGCTHSFKICDICGKEVQTGRAGARALSGWFQVFSVEQQGTPQAVVHSCCSRACALRAIAVLGDRFIGAQSLDHHFSGYQIADKPLVGGA
jgi:hypothetical protein